MRTAPNISATARIAAADIAGIRAAFGAVHKSYSAPFTIIRSAVTPQGPVISAI